MYEKFSDRARKVMQLANQEAQRRNHEYVGTEHILMGIAKEGSGVAVAILKNLDIDFCKIRLEVDKIIQDGPEMITLGKLPKTPRAKKVIEYAMEESIKFGHNYVGTEHILLGCLVEREGVAAQVLENLGLTVDILKTEIINLLGEVPSGKTDGHPSTSHTPPTPYPTTFTAGTAAYNTFGYTFAGSNYNEIKDTAKYSPNVLNLMRKIKPLLQQIVDAMEEEGL
jgi:ATP-dependent Clp protease ATP-binding subunit ClpC